MRGTGQFVCVGDGTICAVAGQFGCVGDRADNEGDEVDNEAFDQESHSMIRLNNNTVLLLKEVSKVLAVVCIVREEHFQQQGLIEYNFKCFKDAISQVFAVRAKALVDSST